MGCDERSQPGRGAGRSQGPAARGHRDHDSGGGDLPKPSRAGKGRPLVVPPVQIALKAALYDAWRGTGISQRRLARETRSRRERGAAHVESEHSTNAAAIDRALCWLGKRVTVTVGEAA